MLTVTLTGADALDARLERLPAIVLAALAARSALLADQLLARTKSVGLSARVEGPMVSGASVITSLVTGEEKTAAIRVSAPPVASVLPERQQALARTAGASAAPGQVAAGPSSGLPLAALAGAIDAQLKDAAVAALQAQKGA